MHEDGAPSSGSSKQKLRQQYREQRRSLSAVLREQQVRRASEHFALVLPKLCGAAHEGRRVASYKPVDAEFDPSSLESQLRAHGCELAYARCEGDSLAFCLEATASWDVGRFGILEPHGPAIDPAELVLVLVPAVAVDAFGHRLGFGGGYYDRFFARFPTLQPRSCALCFVEQRCSMLPSDSHDVRLHRCLDADGMHLMGEQRVELGSALRSTTTAPEELVPGAPTQVPEEQ